MAPADLDQQGLEAIPASRGGARGPLILIDDGEGLPRPPQIASALGEVLLPRRAGRVFAHLEAGGLPDSEEGLPLQRRGANLRRCGGEKHPRAPVKTVQGWTVESEPRPS